MSNEKMTFSALADRARADEPPAVDVADAVQARIGQPRRDVLLWVFTTVSAAAAMVVAVMTVRELLMRLDALPSLTGPAVGLGVLP
jgi:hypothetical protein